MGKFLEIERQRLVEFKKHTPYLSDAARIEGVYKKGKSHPICLPRGHAEENLFPGIRETAPAYFSKFEIKWHDGQAGKPSNHLCDSQVCCVNFLFPFGQQPDALAELLRPVFPDLAQMLPIENEQYVAFEWIGQHNYLGENVSRNGKRTRGANFTSADAAVMFERTDGKRQFVLIEWKYTEAYNGKQSIAIAKSGTDRRAIYRPLFDRPDCLINKTELPSFDALFYEPFYQLMRQQLLAHEMEKVQELGADVVSVLHIAPEHNTDFRRVTSPALDRLGETATGVWQRLVTAPDRFTSVSTEALFGNLVVKPLPEMQAWADYIRARYRWILSHDADAARLGLVGNGDTMQYPKFLEVNGKPAFVVLTYAEYVRIEEELQELEDIRALRQAKAQDTDAPAMTLAEVSAQYGLDTLSEQASIAAGALPQDLAESLVSAADQMETSVEALIQEAIRQYLAARRREQLEQEIAAYEAMHARLWQELSGKWVAIHKGELVDQDRDRVELYRRVRQRFGRKPVLMREVKAEAIEEIWLRTPSTGRLSR
ncbi:MAG: hypothetical protein R6W76_23330 [Caldilinea sp.]